jgi:hypothetical protein
MIVVVELRLFGFRSGEKTPILCAEIGLCSAGSPHGNSSPFLNPLPNATTANDKSHQIVPRNKVDDSQRCRFQRRWSFRNSTLIILHVMMLRARTEATPDQTYGHERTHDWQWPMPASQDRPGALLVPQYVPMCTPMEKPGRNNQNSPTTRVFDGLHRKP